MAVNSGILPLSLVRGIAFYSVVLQCKDDAVAVTGTLSPNVVGTFALCGRFANHDLYILTGAPSTFVYFNAAEGGYVMARILTTAALTDYWSPAVALTTDPTGTYVAHGANSGTATVTDNPVDLTNYTPQAQVRRTEMATDITLDLNPSVTDAVNGEITIPQISSANTKLIDFYGTFHWDLVLVNNTNERLGPFVKGPFIISDNITQT